MNALPCGMIRMAKLRWPRRERSWCLVQHGARRKLALDVRFVVRQTCVAEGRWVVGGEACDGTPHSYRVMLGVPQICGSRSRCQWSPSGVFLNLL